MADVYEGIEPQTTVCYRETIHLFAKSAKYPVTRTALSPGCYRCCKYNKMSSLAVNKGCNVSHWITIMCFPSFVAGKSYHNLPNNSDQHVLWVCNRECFSMHNGGYGGIYACIK